MSQKNFGLQGIGNKPEMGRDGHILDATNSAYLKIADKDEVLLPVKGAASTASDEFVTQAQLDAVGATVTGEYNAFAYDATAALTQLSGEGSGDGGALLRGDKYKISNDGSVLGTAVNAGDVLVVLVDNAPLSGTSPTPEIGVHFLVVGIKDANDLADDSTLEAVNNQLQIKDDGISSAKLQNDVINSGDLIADDVVDSEHIVAGSLDNEHYAALSITSDKVANNTLPATKMAAAVQTTLSNADTQFGTRNDNFEAAIGGSFDADNDASIAAQSNYLTATNIVSQLAQADARMKLDNDDNALRVASVTHDGGDQNIGSPIKSGRTLTAIKIRPVTAANGSGCSMTIGVSGDPDKYCGVIDLYESTVQVVELCHTLTSDEQIVAFVTAGTASEGTFTVAIEHG